MIRSHLMLLSFSCALCLAVSWPTLAVEASGSDSERGLGSCTPSATVLCLVEGRFSVEVDWQDFDTNTGTGSVGSTTSDTTGYFWFTDSEQPAMYVKVLDGTAINSFYWVFFASLTNWQYTLTVTDTVTSAEAVYTNPLGSFTSVTDTSALPEDPGRVGVPVPREISGPGSGDRGVSIPTECSPGATTLCLDDRRFRVEVDRMDFSGFGLAQPVTDHAGYFAFFVADNVDLMVRIVDGGAGDFWFFYGATNNAEYTITVTDVCNGATKIYDNPAGVLTSFGDFEAFEATASCTLPIFEDGFESGGTSAW